MAEQEQSDISQVYIENLHIHGQAVINESVVEKVLMGEIDNAAERTTNTESDGYYAFQATIPKPLAEPEKHNKDLTWLVEGKMVMYKKQPLSKGNKRVFYGKQQFGPKNWREVAIKLIEYQEKNLRELEILQRLIHPNIVQIYDAGERRGDMFNYIYIAMELCDQNLRDYVEANSFDFQKSFSFCKQVADGLAFLHEKNIAHRDLKPDNILVSSCKEFVKLSDFGLSKEIPDGQSNVTVTSVGAGTEGYRAPETYQPNNRITLSVDIFPFGLITHFLFSKGKHPFGCNPYEWAKNITKKQHLAMPNIPQFSECHSYKRAQLVDLLQQTLKHNPRDRPNATEIQRHVFFSDSIQDEKAEVGLSKKTAGFISFLKKKVLPVKDPPGQSSQYDCTLPASEPEGSTNRFVALHDCDSQKLGDLNFKEGNVLLIVEKFIGGWWKARSVSSGREGYIPSNYVAEGNTFERERWYYGNITRDESENLLKRKGNKEGTFLIRLSESLPKESKLGSEGKFYINEGELFNSLGDLIEHYMDARGGLFCRLTTPCPMHEVQKPPLIDPNLEIPREHLIITKRMGGRMYTESWKGLWKNKTDVVIKTMKPVSKMSPESFFEEARILNVLRNDRIVSLLAVVSDKPHYIITEFMCNGDLKRYLKGAQGSLCKFPELMNMASQISSGMLYVGSMNYVHRDLRAVNVLIGREQVCKIRGFGLAALMCEGKYVAEDGEKFPYKWTSPEAALYGISSVKSDVWSFGVLLTEIVTRGETPYPGMENTAVVENLVQGYRMPKMQNCPESLYELMLKCWNQDRMLRPTFEYMQKFLDDFVDSEVTST